MDFSKIVDVAASSVSDWEAGRAAFPANQIYKLAKKLGVSPAWLLTGEGEMEAKPKGEES